MPFIKGYKPTAEHRRKLSESHKGKAPNNKGKKMSQDFRDKCRKRLIGTKQSTETIEKRVNQYRGENHWNYVKDRSKLQKYGEINKERRSSIYNDWRKKVLERDERTCKINNQDCNGRLEAHHILGFTEHPELRYDINNGITLCHFHHPREKEEEKRLSPYFKDLVSVSKENH